MGCKRLTDGYAAVCDNCARQDGAEVSAKAVLALVITAGWDWFLTANGHLYCPVCVPFFAAPKPSLQVTPSGGFISVWPVGT